MKDKARESELLAQMQEDAKGVEAPPDLLLRINNAYFTLKELRERLVAEEAKAANTTDEIRKLEHELLPSLMDQAGMAELSIEDGEATVKLTRDNDIYASISEANAPAATSWLVRKGFGALVKTVFAVQLDKGAMEEAQRVRVWLKKGKVGFAERSAVNAQTLKAFVREAIEAGRELPASITHHIEPVVRAKEKKKKR